MSYKCYITVYCFSVNNISLQTNVFFFNYFEERIQAFYRFLDDKNNAAN